MATALHPRHPPSPASNGVGPPVSNGSSSSRSEGVAKLAAANEDTWCLIGPSLATSSFPLAHALPRRSRRVHGRPRPRPVRVRERAASQPDVRARPDCVRQHPPHQGKVLPGACPFRASRGPNKHCTAAAGDVNNEWRVERPCQKRHSRRGPARPPIAPASRSHASSPPRASLPFRPPRRFR